MEEERRAEREKEVLKKIQEARDALAKAAKSTGPQSDAQKAFDQQFIVTVRESFKSKDKPRDKPKDESSTGSESSE